MKNVTKVVKKALGIKKPSEMNMSMDVPSLYPHTLSINAEEARKAQDALYKSLLNSRFGAAGTVKLDPIEESEKKDTPEKDEWIWVNGYKGTDKDMKCRDFQYELDKQFDMEEGDVKLCESGFHLCLDLDDVFNYYEPEDGNRYFHVRALVRKEDFEKYNAFSPTLYWFPYRTNKIAAKSIRFLSEVSRDELNTALSDKYGEKFTSLPDKYKAKVPEISVNAAVKLVETDRLIKAGYPSELAEYIVKHDSCTNDAIVKAYELAPMTTITLDTKMVLIFS